MNIKKYLFRTDLELNEKWWHRLLKVIFVIGILVQTILLLVYFANSYHSIVNQWIMVESFSNRLSVQYPTGVYTIRKLFSDNEIIVEGNIYSQYYLPDLENKEYLLPSSAIFLYTAESFCSNELDKEIRSIASSNEINLFSTTNPSLRNLSSDIDKFAQYLKGNIKCVMIDSYTTANDDGTNVTYTFLKPVDTSDYWIYKYSNNFWGFLMAVVIAVVSIIIGAIVTILIYQKIFLYIIYGNKKLPVE